MQKGRHSSCVMSKLKRFIYIARKYSQVRFACYYGYKNRTNLGLCVSGSKSEVEFLPSIKGHPYKLLPSSATSSNAVGDNGREDPFRGTMLLLLLLRLF